MKANSPALLLLGRLGASGLALVSAPIVARAIGPEGRGETAAAVALFALVPIFLGFGLPLELRRIVAVDGSTASVRSSRRLIAFTGLVSVPVAWVCSATIFQEFDSGAKIAASFGVALTPLTLSWICDTSVLVARRDYIGIVALQLLQPLGYVVGVTMLWVANLASTGTVIWVYVASNIVSFIFGLQRVRASRIGVIQGPSTLIRGSLRFAGGSLAESASNRLDQVVALPVMGAAQAGFYSVGVTVGLAPLAIAQALGAASFTNIATAQGRRRRRLVNQSICQVASLSFASASIMFVLGPSLVVLLFGDAFYDAKSAIQVSALACVLASVSLQASTVLIATGRAGRLAISQLTSLVVGIGFLLVLGPALGALGAALASAIGYGIMATLSLSFCGASPFSIIPTPASFMSGLKSLLRTR